ncbi:MAG TPA: DUF1570 domain-containing protein [Pirellulaceae bacterium]|nr:DUF1570 domain-containing protein [Pirellulaceae bacterium]
MRTTLRLAIACVLAAGVGSTVTAADRLIRLDIPGRTGFEGTPLAWSSQQVFFLARDGQLVECDPRQATNFSEVPGGFKSCSQGELRGLLMAEFSGYEVSGVGHYLVVHPAGRRDEWAPRFEELYRSFVVYFSARGWRLEEPQFPLVAVVFPRQIDFARHAAREGLVASSGVLGYYSTDTNRILMYDSGASGNDWTATADTIIHEAAHQTAFNTGVHSRFGTAPRWVVEGLGTMFEARGVWNSRNFPHVGDRINRGRLQAWRQYSRSRRRADAIAQLVASDRPFQADADGAYSEAWALSFYLSETQPQKYSAYLARTAATRPFSTYRSQERMKDFTDIFGSDLAMLDAQLQRYLAGLK